MEEAVHVTDSVDLYRVKGTTGTEGGPRSALIDNQLSVSARVIQPLSGLMTAWRGTQGRTVAGRRCDGSTLGWITQSLQDCMGGRHNSLFDELDIAAGSGPAGPLLVAAVPNPVGCILGAPPLSPACAPPCRWPLLRRDRSTWANEHRRIMKTTIQSAGQFSVHHRTAYR